jgi:hypothetical protein
MLVKNTSDFHSAYYLESSAGVVNEKIRITNNSRDAVLCRHVVEQWNISCKRDIVF